MQEKFTTEIYAENAQKGLGIQEAYKYKDLIIMFVKKNFTSLYKQTILGPLWIIVNPLLTSVIFTFIFSELAGISTEGVPQLLFYMSGNIFWTFFSGAANEISRTFLSNIHMFSKVYFSRLALPVATLITGFINFLLQFVSFFIFYIYYLIIGENVQFSITILLIPVILLQAMILGMGTGLIIASITSKYRDLVYVFPILVQLLMYVTPIVYPSSSLGGITKIVVMLNPVSSMVDIFRNALLNVGVIEWGYWGISVSVSIMIFFIGLKLFRKTEKSFVDVI